MIKNRKNNVEKMMARTTILKIVDTPFINIII